MVRLANGVTERLARGRRLQHRRSAPSAERAGGVTLHRAGDATGRTPGARRLTGGRPLTSRSPTDPRRHELYRSRLDRLEATSSVGVHADLRGGVDRVDPYVWYAVARKVGCDTSAPRRHASGGGGRRNSADSRPRRPDRRRHDDRRSRRRRRRQRQTSRSSPARRASTACSAARRRRSARSRRPARRERLLQRRRRERLDPELRRRRARPAPPTSRPASSPRRRTTPGRRRSGSPEA